MIVDIGKYECVCPPGFTGERCLNGKYEWFSYFMDVLVIPERSGSQVYQDNWSSGKTNISIYYLKPDINTNFIN